MLAVVLALSLLAACKSGQSTASDDRAPAEPEHVSAPIPPDSPFAKVKVGMGSDEVFATIGQPTSMTSYATGKAWIPFHYGGDNARSVAHYKGIGSITFSQNHAFTSGMSVMRIDYDPSDPGFERKS
jgi:hypothetical protein